MEIFGFHMLFSVDEVALLHIIQGMEIFDVFPINASVFYMWTVFIATLRGGRFHSYRQTLESGRYISSEHQLTPWVGEVCWMSGDATSEMGLNSTQMGSQSLSIIEKTCFGSFQKKSFPRKSQIVNQPQLRSFTLPIMSKDDDLAFFKQMKGTISGLDLNKLEAEGQKERAKYTVRYFQPHHPLL